MLRTAATSLARSLAKPNEAKVVVQYARGLAMEGMKGYGDKEKAVEDMFFRKEEEKVLQKLLAKVRQQAHHADTHGAAGAVAAELSALEAIVGKSVSDAEKKALLEWKHTSY